MIALALSLQLLAASADVPAQVTVRHGDRAVALPVSVFDEGPAVRGDELAAALGGEWRPMGVGAWRLVLPSARADFEAGTAWAVVGGEPVPLSAPPVSRAGVLWLPYAVVSDVVPRIASGVLYDASKAEIRVFRSSTGGLAAPAAPRAATARASRAGDRPDQRSIGPRPDRRAVRTVVVDAGHGGPDRGMHGPWGCRASDCVYEADITLAVAKRVAQALEQRGLRVVMTRTRDTLIALSDRGHIANRVKGDLFLSIHVNAANPRWKQPGTARGFETYFLSEAKTEDARRVAQMENESVRFETAADAPAGDGLSFLLNDMAQNEHLRESSELAGLVQSALRRVHPGPNRGVKQAGFRVLVTAFMPAVLIEIGFGTNPSDASWMTAAREQVELADAIADAAEEYLTRYERRVGAGGGAP